VKERVGLERRGEREERRDELSEATKPSFESVPSRACADVDVSIDEQ